MSRTQADIRLLMVDDEREFLRAVEPGLVKRGFEVTPAEDGTKALELLNQKSFDVVLLDVKMPGIDGVDVFRQIKKVSPELPVVLLTGHGNVQQAFETTREGVQDYLTKPCDVETLTQVLREAVARSGARVEVEEAPGEEIDLLLVDDDMDFVRSITPALERRGVVVTPAHDGTQALEAVRDRRYPVALVDVVMPWMDGLTLMDHLQTTDPLMEVIILTGNPRVGDVRKGLKEGAFDYLIKPCRIEELIRTIRAAHQRRREREETAARASAEAIFLDQPD